MDHAPVTAIWIEKQLPNTWAEACITLPESYRPIMLLNVDHKLLATILETRLNKILEHYIHGDQVRFVQKRQLRISTRRLCNVIAHVQGTKAPTVIYSCDAEKAFDTVHWKFMKIVMREIGFG